MNAICSHLDTIELTELARSAEPGEDWSRRHQQLRADRREWQHRAGQQRAFLLIPR